MFAYLTEADQLINNNIISYNPQIGMFCGSPNAMQTMPPSAIAKLNYTYLSHDVNMEALCLFSQHEVKLVLNSIVVPGWVRFTSPPSALKPKLPLTGDLIGTFTGRQLEHFHLNIRIEKVGNLGE